MNPEDMQYDMPMGEMPELGSRGPVNNNRIFLNGTWHVIEDMGDWPLSRLHSVTYPLGHVWQIAFGSTILELTPYQAIQLQAICAGIDDSLSPMRIRLNLTNGIEG